MRREFRLTSEAAQKSTMKEPSRNQTAVIRQFAKTTPKKGGNKIRPQDATNGSHVYQIRNRIAMLSAACKRSSFAFLLPVAPTTLEV